MGSIYLTFTKLLVGVVVFFESLNFLRAKGIYQMLTCCFE